jgi:hypothetical protein
MYLISFKLGGDLLLVLSEHMRIVGYPTKKELLDKFGAYAKGLNSEDFALQMETMSNMLHYDFKVINFPFEANELRDYVEGLEGIKLPSDLFGGINAARLKDSILNFQEEDILDLLLEEKPSI